MNATIVLTQNSRGVPSGKVLGGSPRQISAVGAGVLDPGTTARVMTKNSPLQLLGLVPLLSCNQVECRDTQSLFCYLNPVFATIGSTDSNYENDFSSFFLDYNSSNELLSLKIEKEENPFFTNKPYEWTSVATIVDNTYGQYFAPGSFSTHPTYVGVIINWAKVLSAFGPGIYRIAGYTCPGAIVHGSYTQSSSGFPTHTTVGTITIGDWEANIIYDTNINNAFRYIAGIINSSGKASAYVEAGQLKIDGTAGTRIVMTGAAGSPFTYTWTLAGGDTQRTLPCTCFCQSIPFLLREWNCDLAHGTVKFETANTGTIGSVINDGQLFDLCGITLYDSVRVRGFFGYSEFEYDEIMEEWGVNNSHPFGQIDRVRTKTVRGYKFNSNLLPMWLHERLATYGFNANGKSTAILVSDYNHNNSDYSIIQKVVVKAGGYKPEYLDPNKFDAQHRYQNRTSNVSILFKQGIQGLIHSMMCKTTAPLNPGGLP